MTRKRSRFAGMTDYTGVSLEDIIDHIRLWRDNLAHDTAALTGMMARLDALPDSTKARGGRDHAGYFLDLLSRYVGDLDRLLDELPRAVCDRHEETISQLFESSRHAEDLCVTFKERYDLSAINPDDPADTLLSEIYALTRNAVIDLSDLGNVSPRVRTYIDHRATTPPQSEPLINALELKPNFFGLGLNLNYILNRLIRRKGK